MRTVSIARSEYFCCLPGFPDFGDFQDFIAEGDIQSVRFPLFRRDFSYSDQLVTLYFFLYAGFLLRLWDSFILDSIKEWNLLDRNIYAPTPFGAALV